MLIVPYSDEHKDSLVEIFRKNTPKFYAIEEEGDFVDFLNRDTNFFYTIKSLNEIAGGGGYTINDDRARLLWNMIDPKFHGQGLGRALLNFCIDKIKESRYTQTIEVWTSEYAKDFYSKFGFKVLGRQNDFQGLGTDLYQMQRRT